MEITDEFYEKLYEFLTNYTYEPDDRYDNRAYLDGDIGNYGFLLTATYDIEMEVGEEQGYYVQGELDDIDVEYVCYDEETNSKYIEKEITDRFDYDRFWAIARAKNNK